MEPNIQALKKRKDIAHQEAIVNRAITSKVKPVRINIPSGRADFLKLLKKENSDVLEDALFNWLRGCRFFTEATLSLAEDPSKYSLSVRKVASFETNHEHPIWVWHEEGKRYLARELAAAMQSNKAVAYQVKKEGIFLLTCPDDEFTAYRTVTDEDVEEYRRTYEEEPSFEVGDKLLSDDWLPYIEFIPKNRSQYGRGA